MSDSSTWCDECHAGAEDDEEGVPIDGDEHRCAYDGPLPAPTTPVDPERKVDDLILLTHPPDGFRHKRHLFPIAGIRKSLAYPVVIRPDQVNYPLREDQFLAVGDRVRFVPDHAWWPGVMAQVVELRAGWNNISPPSQVGAWHIQVRFADPQVNGVGVRGLITDTGCLLREVSKDLVGSMVATPKFKVGDVVDHHGAIGAVSEVHHPSGCSFEYTVYFWSGGSPGPGGYFRRCAEDNLIFTAKHIAVEPRFSVGDTVDVVPGGWGIQGVGITEAEILAIHPVHEGGPYNYDALVTAPSLRKGSTGIVAETALTLPLRRGSPEARPVGHPVRLLRLSYLGVPGVVKQWKPTALGDWRALIHTEHGNAWFYDREFIAKGDRVRIPGRSDASVCVGKVNHLDPEAGEVGTNSIRTPRSDRIREVRVLSDPKPPATTGYLVRYPINKLEKIINEEKKP